MTNDGNEQCERVRLTSKRKFPTHGENNSSLADRYNSLSRARENLIKTFLPDDRSRKKKKVDSFFWKHEIRTQSFGSVGVGVQCR